MPLPSPRNQEEKNKFISRCLSDDNMHKEFKNNQQRVAVCFSLYKKAKRAAETKAGEEQEEITWEKFGPDESYYWY